MNNQEKKPVKILFVCLGNICRSPAAEGVFLEILRENQALERYTVDSAGTGGYHIGELPDSRMRVHARQRGLELVHHCRQVTTEDFEDFDLIIGMDSMNLTNLRRKAPSVEAARKIHGMAEFFNPYYEGAEGFELVLDLLQDACLNLYNSLESEKRN